MKVTIIGNGFVGSKLHSQIPSASLIGRDKFDNLLDSVHDTIILAAPTGRRLIVNDDPEKDLSDCANLVIGLQKCSYRRLVHISTVDTYATRSSLDSKPGSIPPLAHYGKNRWYLERAIQALPNTITIRLPSIVDPDIQKNILYDLAYSTWLTKINLESFIQWYPIKNLWKDIVYAIDQNHANLNLISAPIENKEIVMRFRPELLPMLSKNDSTKSVYDIHTSLDKYYVELEEIWQNFEDFFLAYNNKSRI